MSEIYFGFSIAQTNPILHKALAPDAPNRKQLAQGVADIHPVLLCEALYAFLFDTDSTIIAHATRMLKELPDDTLEEVFAFPYAIPQVMDYIARGRFKSPGLMPRIALHPRTHDVTVQYVVENRADLTLLSEIADHAHLLRRNPALIRIIREHPLANEPLRKKVNALVPPWEALPAELRGHLPEDAPINVRLSIVQGLLPLEPDAFVHLLFHLFFDPERVVSTAAQDALRDLPDDTLLAAARSGRAAAALDYLARKHLERSQWEKASAQQKERSIAFLSRLLDNEHVLDETVAFIARETDRIALLEKIMGNEERLRRAPEIFHALRMNYLTPPERLATIAALNPAFPEIERDYREVWAPILPKMSEEGEALDFEEVAFDPEFIEEDPESSKKRLHEISSEKKQTLTMRIYKMSNLKKQILARRGNRIVREIIMQMQNTILHECLLSNPRITVEEVGKIAADRLVADEIIRQIANNREWTKHYNIRLTLVLNPKTPVTISLKYVNQLMEQDLAKVGKNKNIPAVVSATAMKLWKQKKRLRR
ncbi:MAG: hypothetical protein D6795_10825 [Deltaproteobacteria bacterium]|nr:MAG: hypothetical protein D6795_10825 [Deltaproteobacteria bacterium]